MIRRWLTDLCSLYRKYYPQLCNSDKEWIQPNRDMSAKILPHEEQAKNVHFLAKESDKIDR